MIIFNLKMTIIKIIGWVLALNSIGMGIYGIWVIGVDSFDKYEIKNHTGQIADIEYKYYHEGFSKPITSVILYLSGEDIAYRIGLGGAYGTLNDKDKTQKISVLKKGDQVELQYRNGSVKKKKIIVSIGFPDQAPLISAEETKARYNNRTNTGTLWLIILGLILIYFLIKK